MTSVDFPFPTPLLAKARALARWLVPLLPIALALAAVTWWPRSAPPRPAAAGVPVPTQAQAQAPAEDDEDRRLAEAIDRARGSTVTLEYNAGEPAGMRRVASGVVFSPVGDVISVRVEPKEGPDRESIVAKDSAGHKHPARFVASDPETGLSLLKLEAEARDIRPIVPTARAALLGAAVFLIGHPYDLGQSVSVGNVAAFNRRVKYGVRPLGGLIQVQVSLHPGDSGALLADRQGGWLGLIRGGGFTPDGKDDNSLGFAITAPDALWVARQLMDHRKVERAYLGVRSGKDTEEPGAWVFRVVSGSPADRAGLRQGDRIVGLDGWPVESRDDLSDRLDRVAADAEVPLEYVRGDDAPRRVAVRTTGRSSATEAGPKPLTSAP